ncbi:MAG TPA: efflux RND transporter periplasmic adaptor subunit [Steroidobacteraceae bacterium]|nr:efflux RND transporter periplasmic adaptor subunit [Steroidobacteraceae bacterium]
MTAAAPLRLPAVIAATATIVLALQGCGHEPTGASAKADTPDLATVVVGTQTAPAELLLDGVVEAVNQATLSAQTAGRVAELYVDVDDAVRQGQRLMTLRATEQVAGLGQAQAALTAARAREAQARAQFGRIQDMYERKVVARTTYDEAVTARDAAAAELAAAQAALESAREGVAYTELRAPYDGRITAKRVQPGEAVAPGTPLLTIASFGALRVVAEVPQSLAQDVRALGKANVYVGDTSIAAERVTLFPSADPLSSTFRVRADLPDQVSGIAPGMHAKVGFVTGQSKRMFVPREAVVERSELRAVYVVGPDGRVSLRQVRLGRPIGAQVEVIAGLVDGERVATDRAAAGLAARVAAAPAHE